MPDRISAFTITADEEGSGRSKGRLLPCEALSEPGFQGRLVQHKNYRGRNYEENHLEEWIARQPSSIFGATPVLLIASQNYTHLPVKIDLLFVDARCQLYPIEVKVVRAAKNGGVVPYDLYERQMKPYTEFLNGVSHLGALDSQYVRFANEFNGVANTLAEAFSIKFGRRPSENLTYPSSEIYVAEDFDTYSVDYFERRSKEDGRNVRLICYKFFPNEKYIEFWRIYETQEERQ
jgi:hypothetical protein